jgi:hypothetical protein
VISKYNYLQVREKILRMYWYDIDIWSEKDIDVLELLSLIRFCVYSPFSKYIVWFIEDDLGAWIYIYELASEDLSNIAIFRGYKRRDK